MKYLVRKAQAFITAILDLRSTFASATSVAATAGTAILGNVMPLDTTGFNLGQAMQRVYLVIAVTTGLDSTGGAATLAFKLMSHSTETITSGVTHVQTAAFTEAQAVAGTVLHCQPLPQGTYGKYLGLAFTIAGETSTVGAVNAYLTLDPPQGWKAYPNAV
jgi:hypothetical protein